VREYVDNFTLAFVAPLGANNHCCPATLHWKCTLLARNCFRRLKNNPGNMGREKFLLLIDFNREAAASAGSL
jgi:hypothetical protein